MGTWLSIKLTRVVRSWLWTVNEEFNKFSNHLFNSSSVRLKSVALVYFLLFLHITSQGKNTFTRREVQTNKEKMLKSSIFYFRRKVFHLHLQCWNTLGLVQTRCPGTKMVVVQFPGTSTLTHAQKAWCPNISSSLLCTGRLYRDCRIAGKLGKSAWTDESVFRQVPEEYSIYHDCYDLCNSKIYILKVELLQIPIFKLQYDRQSPCPSRGHTKGR